MCNNAIDRYTLCAHNLSSTLRCPGYTTKPRQKCTKTESESTHFSLCPKCKGVRTKQEGNVRIEFLTEEEARSVVSGESRSTSGKSVEIEDEKGVIKWMKRSLRSVAERSIGSSENTGKLRREDEKPERTASEPGLSAARGSVAERRRTSESERLAVGYQKVIGVPAPSFLDARVGGLQQGELAELDIETMTTWSEFLPRPTNPSNGQQIQGRDIDMMTALSISSPNVALNVERRKEELKVISQKGMEREVRQVYTDLKLSERFLEELRCADERLSRVRDGRGDIHNHCAAGI